MNNTEPLWQLIEALNNLTEVIRNAVQLAVEELEEEDTDE